MKKLKLFGSLAAMLLLPTVAQAASPKEFSIADVGDKAQAEQISFDLVDGNATFSVTATRGNQGTDNSSKKKYPKIASGKYWIYAGNDVTITATEGYTITKIEMGYSASGKASFTTAANWTVPAGSTISFNPEESTAAGTLTWTGEGNSVKLANNSAITLAGGVQVTSITITYTAPAIGEDTVVETPYTADFMTETGATGWSLIGWGSDPNYGLNTAYGHEECKAVSPKINLPAGQYKVRMGIYAEEGPGGVKETIELTCSTETPDNDTPRFGTISFTEKDDDVVFEDDTYKLARTYTTTLNIAADGEYYIGIFDNTKDTAEFYQWSDVRIRNFSIEAYEVEVPEWLDNRFAAKASTKDGYSSSVVTATGKYDVVANVGNATLTYGEETVNLTASCNGSTVTFGGFDEFNGDYDTVTLYIPEGAFKTSEGNIYPEAKKELTIEYSDAQLLTDLIDIDGVAVSDDNSAITVTLKDKYFIVQPTARLSMSLYTYYSDAEVQALTVGIPVVDNTGEKTTLTFAMPNLDNVEQGRYYVVLSGMSLRVKNYSGQTWKFNKFKGQSNNFDIVHVVTVKQDNNTYILLDNDTAILSASDALSVSGDVVIPSVVTKGENKYTVVEIAASAFYYNTNITSVEIPATVRNIGANAFAECTGLKTIIAHSNFDVIGKDAFKNCTGVMHVRPEHKNALSAHHDNVVATHFVYGDEETVAFNDGNAYLYVGETLPTGIDATYNRTFKNANWQAFIVPFQVSVENVAQYGRVAELGEDMEVRDGNAYLVWNYVTEGTLDPNKPYLFRPNDGTTNVDAVFSTTGADLAGHNDFALCEARTDDNSIVCSLIGTYTGKHDMASDNGNGTYQLFALKDNKFMFANSDAAKLPPFRFYLKKQVNGASQAPAATIYNAIRENGEVTAIDGVVFEAENNDAIFNLNGNKVQNPEKGIYVKNGKKVVIK